MQKDKTQSRLKDLENLVLSQQDRLFALAYIRIGNRADAEDILQDVFLKLFRSEENLRHVNRLEHYLKLPGLRFLKRITPYTRNT